MKNIITVNGLRVLLAGLLLCGFTGMASLQAVESESGLLFKVHVEKTEAQDNPENIDVSIPLSVLQIAYPALPKEIKEKLEKQGVKIEAVLEEMDKMVGVDIVQVNDKTNKVRVWVEKATQATAKDTDFLKVRISEPGKETPKVNICIPKGFLALAIEIGKGFELDKSCQLTPFLNNETTKHE